MVEFDPTQPFEVVGEGEFDPNQPYETVGESLPTAPQPQTTRQALFESIDPLGIPSKIGTYTSAAWEQVAEFLGKEGVLPGSQTYAEAQKEFERQRTVGREQRKQQFPVASGIGEVVGDVAVPIPGAGAAGLGGAATRVLGQVGLATTAASMRDEDVASAGKWAGGIGAAVEAIPYIGKGVRALASATDSGIGKSAAKLPGRILGVPEVELERYLERAPEIRDIQPKQEIESLANYISKVGQDVDNAKIALESKQAFYKEALAQKSTNIDDAKQALISAEELYDRKLLEKTVAEDRKKLVAKSLLDQEQAIYNEAKAARTDRINELKNQLKNPSQELIAAARTEMKSITDDTVAAAKAQIDTLQAAGDEGLKVDLAPIFSEIEGKYKNALIGGVEGAQAEELKSFLDTWKPIMGRKVDPYEAIKLRQEIDSLINYGSGGAYNGKAEAALGGFRKAINEAIDKQLPKYQPIRDTLAELAKQQEITARLMGKNPEAGLASLAGASIKSKQVSKILERSKNEILQDFLKTSQELRALELAKKPENAKRLAEVRQQYDVLSKELAASRLEEKLVTPSFPESELLAKAQQEKVLLETEAKDIIGARQSDLNWAVQKQRDLGIPKLDKVSAALETAQSVINKGASNIPENLAGKKLIEEYAVKSGDVNLPTRIADIGAKEAIFGTSGTISTGTSGFARVKQLYNIVGGEVVAAPMDLYRMYQGLSKSKYAVALENSFAKGGKDAMMRTHFLLQSSDPEYRKETSKTEQDRIPIDGTPLESAAPGPGSITKVAGALSKVANTPEVLARGLNALKAMEARVGTQAYKNFIKEMHLKGESTLAKEGGFQTFRKDFAENFGNAIKAEFERLFR